MNLFVVNFDFPEIMGLSNEGLFLSLIIIWVPIGVFQTFVLRRARGEEEAVKLVVFLLILAAYTLGSMLSILAGKNDLENSEISVWIISFGEIIWLLSPVIASLSCGSNIHVYPKSKPELYLSIRRGFFFGVPLCFFFAAGDQILLQIAKLLGTANTEFLSQVGTQFGYTGSNIWIQYFIGFSSNFTFGPFIDFFAPSSESIYVSTSLIGIASYFLYAIPEEIGWSGTLYPLILKRVTRVVPAMLWTGLVWGIWHLPYLYIQDGLTIVAAVLYVCSCMTTRCLLTSLIRPVRRDAALLETTLISPSILPAIFAHAALNVWWSFFRLLFVFSSWTGPEYSLSAILWQLGIIVVLVAK